MSTVFSYIFSRDEEERMRTRWKRGCGGRGSDGREGGGFRWESNDSTLILTIAVLLIIITK